ncbi:hypothetical protein MBLNU459_g5979t1 [Dothideomycetes sp. NU459]
MAKYANEDMGPLSSMRSPVSPIEDSHFVLPSPLPYMNHTIDPLNQILFDASLPTSGFSEHIDLDGLNDFSWEADVGDPFGKQCGSGLPSYAVFSSSLPLSTNTSSGIEKHVIDDFFSLPPPQDAYDNQIDVGQPTPTLSDGEQDVVRNYLQQTLHSQFPFLDETTSRNVSSQLLVLTSLSRTCLASLGFHGLNYKSTTLGELGLSCTSGIVKQTDSYEVTVNKCLGDFVEQFNTNTSINTVDDQGVLVLEAQMCAAQTIYSKVVRKDSTWLKQLDMLATMTAVDYSKPLDGGVSQLEIFQDLLIVLDILASTSTGEAPAFASKFHGRFELRNIMLEKVTGCDTSVMECILDVSNLQAWNRGHILNDSPSIFELVRRALKIEEKLDQARRKNLELQRNRSTGSRMNHIRIITNIFACATSVYLHIVVSGARPKIQEIKQGVTDTIEALKSIADPDIEFF